MYALFSRSAGVIYKFCLMSFKAANYNGKYMIYTHQIKNCSILINISLRFASKGLINNIP